MWPKAILRWLMLATTAGSLAFAEPLPDFRPARRVRPGPKAPVQASAPRALPIPDDAVALAWQDLQTLPEYDRCFTRYVFLPQMDGDKADDRRSLKTASLGINYVNRSSIIRRPVPVGEWLARIDLRWYAPRSADLAEWLRFWEELAFDPAFSLLVTKDAIASQARFEWVAHPGGKFTYPPGCTQAGEVHEDLAAGEYKVHYAAKAAVKDVVRYNSRAIDPEALEHLQRETHSAAPVVEHRYLISRLLTTIKDGAVFAKVFGGLYYEFAGVRLAKDVKGAEKATDLDLYFESLGIGNIKAGLTADRLFDRLRSDQAAILFRSGVTGKPREALSFNTPAGKGGTGWGSITGDVKDGNIDIGDRPFANLLTPRRDAREAIFPRANDLLLFALFDGKGARQDEVPPDIAHDSTIPYPHTQRLQILGCITCHSMQGVDGWQPLQNDAVRLLAKGLDVFGDKHRFDPETVDRIAGLYTGDFSKNIRRARNDLAEATLRATGPWKESSDQADVCKLAATRLHSEYGDYWWKTIDARRALWEIGLEVSKEQALSLFREIVPPDPTALTHGILPEDPRIGALAAGLEINRADFALARDFIAERAMRSPLYRKLRNAK